MTSTSAAQSKGKYPQDPADHGQVGAAQEELAFHHVRRRVEEPGGAQALLERSELAAVADESAGIDAALGEGPGDGGLVFDVEGLAPVALERDVEVPANGRVRARPGREQPHPGQRRVRGPVDVAQREPSDLRVALKIAFAVDRAGAAVTAAAILAGRRHGSSTSAYVGSTARNACGFFTSSATDRGAVKR
jgi:hypothetical protein